MLEKLFDYGVFLISAYAILVGLSLIPIVNFSIDNSVSIWFPRDDPGIADYKHFLQNFGELEWTFIAVESQDNVYSSAFLHALQRVTKSLESLENVKKVVSLANLRDNFNEDNVLRYRRLLPDAPWTTSQLKTFKERIARNPVFQDSLVKKGDDTATVLVVQTANHFGEIAPYRIKLVDSMHTILKHEKPIKAYGISGTAVINAELNRSSKRDMFVFYPLISIIVTMVGWAALRNMRDLSVLLTMVAGTMCLTMGTLLATGHSLNMVTIVMPTILMTISVVDIVHLIEVFHEQRKRSSVDAAIRAVKELWRPSVGIALTTVIGFLSLCYTEIVPVYELGLFGALGSFLAWLLSLSIGPALLVHLWRNTDHIAYAIRPPSTRTTALLEWLYRLSASYSKRIIVIFAIVGAMFTVPLIYLKADTNYLHMFRSSTQVRDAYHLFERHGMGTNMVSLVIESALGKDFTDPELVNATMRLQEQLATLSLVRKTLSPIDMLRQVDRALAEPKNWTGSFTGMSQSRIAQELLVAQMSGNDDLADLLPEGWAMGRIVVITDYLSGKQMVAFREHIEQLAQETFPAGVKFYVTETPILWANMDKYLLSTQVSSLFITLLIVIILMAYTFRSTRLALLGIIPNLFPIVIILGIMGAVGIEVNMATVLIGSIVMGLAVDDTIRVIYRFQQELLERSDYRTALRCALLTTGRPIIFMSFILMLGFGSMAVSDFTPTAEFGILTSMTTFLALIADLLLTPALLLVLQTGSCRDSKLRVTDIPHDLLRGSSHPTE